MNETTIVDGTETRRAELRLRTKGMEELLTGLGKNGFCATGPGRIFRVDDQLVIEFCVNVGTYETRIKAMSIAFDVQLTEDEQKFVPPEVDVEKEQDEASPPVVTVPPAVL